MGRSTGRHCMGRSTTRRYTPATTERHPGFTSWTLAASPTDSIPETPSDPRESPLSGQIRPLHDSHEAITAVHIMRWVPTFIDQVLFGPLAEPGPPQIPIPTQNQTHPLQQTTPPTETHKTNPKQTPHNNPTMTAAIHKAQPTPNPRSHPTQGATHKPAHPP